MSILRLGAVVVCEDVTKRAAFSADEGPASAGNLIPLVRDQPPGQPLSVALGEFADDGACLVPAVGQPDLGLFLEGDDRLPDFARFQQSRLSGKGKDLGRGPAPGASAKCLPNQAGMTGCQLAAFLDLGEACANVLRESAINCYASHAVS